MAARSGQAGQEEDVSTSFLTKSTLMNKQTFFLPCTLSETFFTVTCYRFKKKVFFCLFWRFWNSFFKKMLKILQKIYL